MKNVTTAADKLAYRLKKKLGCDASYISVRSHDNLYYFGHSEKTSIQSTFRVDNVDETVCKIPISRNSLFLAGDLSDEPGFSNLPYVQSGLIKAYVGVPIQNDNQEPIGAVCLISSSERNWSTKDIFALKESAVEIGEWLSLSQKSAESQMLSEALLNYDNTLLALANNLDLLASVHDHTGTLLFGTNQLTQSLSVEQIETTVIRGIRRRENFQIVDNSADAHIETPLGPTENFSVDLDLGQQFDFVWTCRVVGGENDIFVGKWTKHPKKPNSHILPFRNLP